MPEDAEDPHGGDRAGDGALAPGGVAEVVASARLEDLREQKKKKKLVAFKTA